MYPISRDWAHAFHGPEGITLSFPHGIPIPRFVRVDLRLFQHCAREGIRHRVSSCTAADVRRKKEPRQALFV